MKNKSGFLLAEETLKIVIALISITFLIYFLTSLYFTNKDSKDLELAKASLNHLMEEINQNNPEVEIYNPESDFWNPWHLTTWPYNGIKPLSCENLGWENCICICSDNNKEACDEKGICLNNEKKLTIPEGAIKLENPPIKLGITNEVIKRK